MKEHETRLTPETDAECKKASYRFSDAPEAKVWIDSEFARKLERERNEAREEIARLQTMAASVADVIAKGDAMLEAIREAIVLIADCNGRASDATLQMHANNDAKGVVDDVWLWSELALAKLKPFLP